MYMNNISSGTYVLEVKWLILKNNLLQWLIISKLWYSLITIIMIIMTYCSLRCSKHIIYFIK